MFGPLAIVGLLLLGWLWWTLTEYLLHRFAFHTRNPLMGRRHRRHHADTDVKRLAIAPPFSIALGAGLHAAVFLGAIGGNLGAWLMAGFMLGYVAYEWIHFASHYVRPRTPVGRWLRAWHLAHHNQTPKLRFGVTMPLWDLVFRTYRPLSRPS